VPTAWAGARRRERLSLCVGAGPPRAELFLHRAAYAALGRPDRALRDRGEALRLGLGRRALAAVAYNLAVKARADDDRKAMREHAERALRDDPEHLPSKRLLDQSRPRP
jgi:tetratricopeptide (TPR) repeat protein